MKGKRVIVGSGVDVIEIARIERALARHGERFLARLLAPSERAACARLGRPAPRIALCFAAKEAVMKAVGTGLARGVRWADIETRLSHTASPAGRRDPGDRCAAALPAAASGLAPSHAAPRTLVVLHGRVAEITRERGAARCWLAVSRSRAHAVAVALLESENA